MKKHQPSPVENQRRMISKNPCDFFSAAPGCVSRLTDPDSLSRFDKKTRTMSGFFYPRVLSTAQLATGVGVEALTGLISRRFEQSEQRRLTVQLSDRQFLGGRLNRDQHLFAVGVQPDGHNVQCRDKQHAQFHGFTLQLRRLFRQFQRIHRRRCQRPVVERRELDMPTYVGQLRVGNRRAIGKYQVMPIADFSVFEALTETQVLQAERVATIAFAQPDLAWHGGCELAIDAEALGLQRGLQRWTQYLYAVGRRLWISQLHDAALLSALR